MRPALLVSLIVAAATIPIGFAGAAEPASNPSAKLAECWHEPVVNGRQAQPRPGDLACLNGKAAPPPGTRRQIDKDEAEILNILKRSENQPPLEGVGR